MGCTNIVVSSRHTIDSRCVIKGTKEEARFSDDGLRYLVESNEKSRSDSGASRAAVSSTPLICRRTLARQAASRHGDAAACHQIAAYHA